MSRILVPVDFSENSGNALHYAVELAKTFNKQLSVLHCYPEKVFSRPYNFGKQPYREGIIEKLEHFVTDHIGEKPARMRLLAKAGGVVDSITMLSKGYDLVLLSSNHFNTRLERWMGSRSSYIASAAHCPVLIISRSTQYRPWNTIWHIRKQESEKLIVEKAIKQIPIPKEKVVCKTFNQTTFSSVLWQSIVAYEQTHTAALKQKILNICQNEKLDLIIFVSEEKSTFQKLINDDAIHLIFQFNIPVLVVQAKN